MEKKELVIVSIVLTGGWNMKIFTPNWVMNYFLRIQEGEKINFGINASNLNYEYTYKGIKFVFSDVFVSFTLIQSIDDQSRINYATEMANKLFRLLPFTPNLAAGFNVKYKTQFEIFNKNKPFYHPEFKNFYLKQIKLEENLHNCVLNILIDPIDKTSEFLTYNFHFSDTSKFTISAIEELFKYTKKLIG